MVDLPPGVIDEEPPRRRRLNPRAVRTLGALVVIAALVILIVQNSQRTTIRFLFITGHVRLVWIVAVCLVLAGIIGFVVGHRSGRRRRRRRPAPD